MVGLTRGLISSVAKSLELLVRSLGIAAREAPAPVMATLLLGFIATTYFVSQVCSLDTVQLLIEVKQKHSLSLKLCQASLTGEMSQIAKYSDAKWEQVHLNYNQTKVSV